MVLFAGRRVQAESHFPASEWGCFAHLSAPIRNSSSQVGRTLLDIQEPPSVLSKLTAAAADWMPTCQVPVSFHKPDRGAGNLDALQCQDRMQADHSCFRQRRTHVCAPLEPLYGAALLPIPGRSSFIAFGGRAAVEQTGDIGACTAQLQGASWRFQYHQELESGVLLHNETDSRAILRSAVCTLP